jgi:hypothetical protein
MLSLVVLFEEGDEDARLRSGSMPRGWFLRNDAAAATAGLQSVDSRCGYVFFASDIFSPKRTRVVCGTSLREGGIHQLRRNRLAITYITPQITQTGREPENGRISAKWTTVMKVALALMVESE